MSKIAFFGGSFNPPNKIHYEIAKTVLKHLNMDEFYFVPVGNYYVKNELIDVRYRYDMLKKMCENKENILVSDITINETRNLKAIDIFKKIEKKYINDELFFVMGADNFSNILTWKNASELIKNYNIIVVERDNINVTNILENNKTLYNRIYVLNIKDIMYEKELKVNSTQIRKIIKQQKKLECVKDFLDEKVIEYIYNKRLYI
nr:nicotinate (nicotinamide) nucleotide adenylyltransferase [Clostridia bacterium]